MWRNTWENQNFCNTCPWPFSFFFFWFLMMSVPRYLLAYSDCRLHSVPVFWVKFKPVTNFSYPVWLVNGVRYSCCHKWRSARCVFCFFIIKSNRSLFIYIQLTDLLMDIVFWSDLKLANYSLCLCQFEKQGFMFFTSFEKRVFLCVNIYRIIFTYLRKYWVYVYSYE